MIDALSIELPPARHPGPAPAEQPGWHELRAIYPWLPLVDPPWPLAGRAADAVSVDAERWVAPDFDPLELDDEIAACLRRRGAVTLAVRAPRAEPGAAGAVALQVITRYQRLLDGRNRHSMAPLFDRALGVHRRLHDLSRPLPAADYDHARDTWRWVLRLDPEASLGTQLAALFHDIERLDSESEVRVEQHSRDYLAFKQAHAAGGAERVRAILSSVAAPPALIDQVVQLVRGHEQPAGDPDRQLLNEADALSFFSLNACGFARYYGPEHTRRKVAFTLGRLGPRGRRELTRIRHRADFQSLIAELS